MSDIQSVQKKLPDFRDERDWKQFHDPINLAIALQLEVSEVLECFQWKAADTNKFKEWYAEAENKQALTNEMADVFNTLLLLAESLDIDLARAAENKIIHNAAKYPVDKAKGKAIKYSKL